jgi:hypothetical protein
VFHTQSRTEWNCLLDIFVVKNGYAIFIEVKSELGKPSQDLDAIVAGGGYIFARSIDDVQNAGRSASLHPKFNAHKVSLLGRFSGPVAVKPQSGLKIGERRSNATGTKQTQKSLFR